MVAAPTRPGRSPPADERGPRARTCLGYPSSARRSPVRGGTGRGRRERARAARRGGRGATRVAGEARAREGTHRARRGAAPRNRRADARDQLRQALELATICSATSLAAERELLATDARPRRIALSGVESLTLSERRVAELAAEGPTNREIAQALFVTQRTVEVHLTSIYRKLAISSRSLLAGALAEPARA